MLWLVMWCKTSAGTTTAESASGSSKAARRFAKPVTKEDIATTMQSAILKKAQRDNKYCYTLWKEWVTHRAMATGEVIPLLCNIALALFICVRGTEKEW